MFTTTCTADDHGVLNHLAQGTHCKKFIKILDSRVLFVGLYYSRLYIHFGQEENRLRHDNI